MCVVILVLGLMPCKDANAVTKPAVKISLVQADKHNEPNQDHCSPFCHCSCCNAPSMVALRVQLYFVVSQLDKSYPELATLKLKSRNLNIWQPPKLAV